MIISRELERVQVTETADIDTHARFIYVYAEICVFVAFENVSHIY